MNIVRHFALYKLGLFLLVACQIFAQGQGYKFHSLTMSSGESTLTSGITGIAQFTKGDSRLIEIAVQQEQAWLVYGAKYQIRQGFNGGLNGLAAASFGHFKGEPWVGPLLTLETPITRLGKHQVSLSTIQWPGFFLYKPKRWNRDPNLGHPLIGYLGGAQLSIGPVGLGYSLQKFLDDPWNELPAISYTKSIGKDFLVSGSATWNNNDRHLMYYLGLTWKPTS